MRHTLLHCLTLGLFGLLLLPAASAHAQHEQQVGLVVRHGNGDVITQCVEIDDAAVSGYDVLAASGLDLSVDFQSMGTAICRIDQEGCGFPGENCFCQCMSSPCIYWSYWQLEDGAWRYSDGGAANTRVVAGAVEGWSWGAGIVGVEADNQPPLYTFDQICSTGAMTATEAETAPTPVAFAQAQPQAVTRPVENGAGGAQAAGRNADAQPETDETTAPATTSSDDAVAPLRPVYAGLALVFGGPLLVGALAFFVMQMRKRKNS